ncbi:MAG: hypothetical protein QOK00_1809 [Thermoleophilaceae bacterium]|nr:hypothetical protein [Thermoleophilaceae bacterium]MEA2456524.1 hypothetical protein [Thermoleophilaceae bacterium]
MILVHIPWVANPFRGDKFAEGWAPAAEMVLDFGALSWGFYRAVDGRLDFIQEAIFPSKAHFERYWYSESLAEKRIELQGYFNVPVLPEFYEVVGEGHALTLAPMEPS